MPRPRQNKFNPPPSAALPAPSSTHADAPESTAPTRQPRRASCNTRDGAPEGAGSGRSSDRLATSEGAPKGGSPSRPAQPGPRPRRFRGAPVRAAEDKDNAAAIAALIKRKEAADVQARQGAQIQVSASQPTKEQAPAEPQSLSRPRSPGPRESPPGPPPARAQPATVERPAPATGLARKAQATPSSVLSLAKFKRRPRESSILRIGPEHESLSLTSLGGDLDDTFGDLENVKPLDESTPFHAPPARETRGTPLAPREVSRLASTPAQPSAATSRKRKIALLRSEPSPAPSPLRSPASSEPIEIGSDPEADAADRDEPTLPAPKRRTVEASQTWSDTMAPPQSSSPVRPETAAPESPQHQQTNQPTGRPARPRGRLSKTAGAPAAKKTRKKAQPEPLATMTTSVLQDLLPRRRVAPPARDEFDLPSDGASVRESSPVEVDEDADELSFIPSKKKRPTARGPKTLKKSAATARKPLATKTPRGKLHNAVKSTSKGNAAKPAKKGQDALSKTYTRRLSDKENEVDEASVDRADRAEAGDRGKSPTHANHTTLMDLPEKDRRKLNRMVRKFREVDKWELAFEDVTASSSSPREAR